jgi:hypothetical protein
MDKKEESVKMPLGTWANLSSTDERKPKIDFKVDVTAKVKFLTNDPKEFPGDEGAYYIFDVEFEEEQMIIMTSAWTLLKELKKLSPLKNKTVLITKRTNKGKQSFEVEEFNQMDETEDY